MVVELFTVGCSEDCGGRACCMDELFMQGDSRESGGTCRAVCEDRLLMCDGCGGKDGCESELFPDPKDFVTLMQL